jgi:CheY-like chemotaxis protein/HPt (histidine-containing phosphotransfer) domain-containing protein
VLDFSKIEAGKVNFEQRPFYLSEVMDQLVTILATKSYEKGVELLFDIAAQLPDAMVGDSERLGQVLLNLLSNAIKFTNQGEIIVRVREQKRTENSICLRFEVHDTGVGLSDEQCARLFQPFEQADVSTTRKYGGTGLGLTISRRLVQMMEGELIVQSTLGHGSCFVFTANLGLLAQQDSTALDDLTGVRQWRIIILDENCSARNILSCILDSLHIEHVAMASGEPALAAIENAKFIGSPFHLAIVDSRMNGMDGLQSIRHLRANPQKYGRIEAISVSAYGQENLVDEADALKLIGNLEKPLTLTKVRDAIFSAMTGQSPVPARVHEVGVSSSILSKLIGVKILLVEDNEVNQELALDILTSHGMQVDVATNGLEAISMVERQVYSLVLMDWQMPVMDGIEATRRIRAVTHFADIPIIAMTANALSGDREKCLSAGMNAHLVKPIVVSDLLTTIAKFVGDALQSNELPNKKLVPAIDTNETVESLTIPHLPDVDVACAIQRLGGNITQYRKIMSSVVNKYSDSSTLLDLEVMRGDITSALLHVHSLKGIAATLGAHKVAATARALELALKGADKEDISFLMEQLSSQLAVLVMSIRQNHIEPLLKHKSTNTRIVDIEELGLAVQKLYCLISEDDSDALQQMKNVAVIANETLHEKELDEVANAINSYDFSNALEKISAWAKGNNFEMKISMNDHKDNI